MDPTPSNNNRQAVALGYSPADSAPRILATGSGAVAARILTLAAAHGVPVHHDPQLAAALSSFSVSDFIPEELFQTVASILAFVYNQNEKFRAINHARE